VTAARARLERALRRGDRDAARAARAAVDEANRSLLDAVSRIRRAAKRPADIWYPQAATLAEIQAALAPDEALVLYGLLAKKALALVVRRSHARLVDLGATSEIETATKVAVPARAGARGVRVVPRTARDWDPNPLRARVFAPLGLGEETKRILVSPDGKLAYVPFALVAGGREVVYVPSGTTYRLLREDAARTGRGVLALGNPDYETARNRRTSDALHRRASFEPLPASGAEAQAVGDVVLLGGEASEGSLRRAIARRPRWSAIHLACHGLIDADRPLLSSLVLASGEGDDGLLTAYEVFQLRLPADLVVLSACETALGKSYRAEGAVGFNRAFMVASGPRVIVSLWKVDDDATRALMVKFYELWKTKPTATALREGQEFVAAQKKWSHPYFWAAWQLWGLPD